MTTEAHTDDEAPKPQAGINIPDHVLLEKISAYPQQDQDDILWLLSYGTDQFKGSRDRICQAIDTDYSTLYKICTGTYPAKIDGVMAKIRSFKRIVTDGLTKQFVETTVTRKVFQTLDFAVNGDPSTGLMVMISGPTGRSKTAAAKEWLQRKAAGRGVYVDVDADGGFRSFIKGLAKACRIPGIRTKNTGELCERIKASFDHRRIIVIDEVSRLFMRRGRVRMQELDFIRRLHDVNGCAIALVVTPVVQDMLEDLDVKAFLEQLVGRIEDPLVIPTEILRSEVSAICKHFLDATPSRELLDVAQAVANGPGKIRNLFRLWRNAQITARYEKERIAERHFFAGVDLKNKRTTWTAE